MEQGFSGQPPISSMDETTQRILDSISDVETRDEYITTNGVKLKLMKVPSHLIMNALNSLKEPEVPTFWDADAKRERQNLDSPAYKQALTDLTVQKGLLTTDIYLAMGTRLMSTPPEIPRPESNEWAQDIEEVTNGGIKIKAEGRARYVAWLKYTVLGDDELDPIMTKIMRLSGTVVEAEATQATNSFLGSNEAEGNPIIRIHPEPTDQGGANI